MFGETSTTAFFPLFVSKSDLAVIAGKVKEAQQKKDLELAERIKLADEKLASVTKLEQENTILKAALGKKNDLEDFLSGLAKKLFLMLEGKPLCLANISNCGFSIRPSP